jgi:DNA polymerase-3 subunit delta'
MRRIDEASMRQALAERRGLSADDAARTARMADGDWIKALELLSADSESRLFLDMFRTLMRLVYAQRQGTEEVERHHAVTRP